jgi:hypothetical protein
MKKRKHKVNKIMKITNAQVEAIEREYYERYNSGIIQWQQNQY